MALLARYCGAHPRREPARMTPTVHAPTDAAAPPRAAPAPVLALDDLHIAFPRPDGRSAEPVRGVSLNLPPGHTLGLIGESGCGKSLTALAAIGLLPPGAQARGRIRIDGEDLLGAPDARWCRLRGARVAMVFQEPMTALDPLQTVAAQVGESLRLHRGLSRAAARAEALRLLEQVRLPQAGRRLDAYPHQLSGGQRQRVMIAAALAADPALLIADEPTTALDASLQREVLALLRELVAERRMALLLISHDLGVVAETVEQVMVMYAGRVVDQGPAGAVFRHLAHPYTRGLFGARPRLGAARGQRLATIPGRVPAATEADAGCAFAPRCPRAVDDCLAAVPPLLSVGPGHAARCIRPWDTPRPAAGAGLHAGARVPIGDDRGSGGAAAPEALT
jgi:peptide/nickel transport system ATP-binding protein